MKKKIIISLFAALTIAASLFLFYKPSNMFANKPASKSGISVCAKALTKQEAKEALGENAGKLFKGKKTKIYPIKVEVANRGLSERLLSLKDVNLNLVSRKFIQQKLYPNYNLLKIAGLGTGILVGSVAICFGLGYALALYVPVGGLTATQAFGSKMVWGMACLGLAPIIGAGVGAVAAPAAMFVYGSKLSKKNNEKTQKLFCSKEFILEPGQIQTLYLFVQEKDYQENLELTFVDGDGNQEVVDCHCAKPVC